MKTIGFAILAALGLTIGIASSVQQVKKVFAAPAQQIDCDRQGRICKECQRLGGTGTQTCCEQAYCTACGHTYTCVPGPGGKQFCGNIYVCQ